MALADADIWHTAGYDGTGVKIAIIDLGFGGYSSLLGTSFPASVTTVNHCQDGFTCGTEHGTAVAELVHQMAPAAQLTLICIDNEVGLSQAEQYVVTNGIKIVTTRSPGSTRAAVTGTAMRVRPTPSSRTHARTVCSG